MSGKHLANHAEICKSRLAAPVIAAPLITAPVIAPGPINVEAWELLGVYTQD